MRLFTNLLFVFFLTFSLNGRGQVSCPIQTSFGNCNVNPVFQPIGTNGFCADSCVQYRVKTDELVDSICIDFGDNSGIIIKPLVLDTIVTHCYNYVPNDTCRNPHPIVINPDAKFYKGNCPNGLSYFNDVIIVAFIKFKPRPRFIVSPNPVCEGVPFSLQALPFPDACTNAFPNGDADYEWFINGVSVAQFNNVTTNGYTQVTNNIINNAGSYPAILTCTNSCGTATFPQTINVSPKPSFTPNLTIDTCTVANITATSNPNNAVDSVKWTVQYAGGGSNGATVTVNPSGANPPFNANITIPNTGTYTITANAYDRCCNVYSPLTPCHWDTTITIYAGPAVSHVPYPNTCDTTINFINDFNLNTADSLVCLIDTIQQSTGAIHNIYSHYGHSPLPQNLTIPATYIVTCIAINACGADTIIDTLAILVPTVVSVTVNPPGICAPDSIVVLTLNTGSATAFAWSTTGTGISPTAPTIQLPVFQITQAGSFSVTLAATNGCCTGAGSNCDTTFNYTLGQQPSIALNIPLQDTCLTLAIPFSSVFTAPAFSDSVRWTVTNSSGSIVSSVVTIPPANPLPYITSTTGTYYVTATAINFCDSVTACDTVELLSPQPVNLPADTAICYTAPNFNLYNWAPSVPPFGNWFVNGIQNVSGIINTSSYPNTTLSIVYVRGTGNCQTSDTASLTITGNSVFAGLDDTLCSNGANYTIPSFNPVGGTWSGGAALVNNLFGIVNPQAITAPSDTFIYAVNIPITSGTCLVTDTVIINIFLPAAADSLVNDTVCTNAFPAMFNNPLPGSNALWNFGDGNTLNSSLPTVTHSYAVIDSVYNISVTLTQTVAPNCTVTAYDTVHILTPPFLAFSLDTNKICQNNSIVIHANNSFNNLNTTYTWHDGLGNIYNVFNPGSFSYPVTANDSDRYTIKVYAENYCGIDSVFFPITVYALPIANFGYTSNNFPDPCSGDTIKFQNNTTGGATSYYWLINGDTVSTSPTPNDTTLATLLNDSVYVITLIAINKCYTSVFTDTLIVHPSTIVPSFYMSAPTKCVNDTITFNSNISSYRLIIWNYGDGNNDSGYVVKHAYANAGTYIVTQIVVGYCGTDSIKDTVFIQDLPSVSFNTSPIILCDNSPVCFTNNSTGTPGGTLIYTWSFGDGDSSVLANPCHQYLTTGVKNVTLLVADLPGQCVSTTTTPISINPAPLPQITVSSNQICLHDSILFSSPSTGQNFIWSLGNGNNQIGNPFYYHYTAHSTYIIQLLIIASNGCRDSITDTVRVYPDATAQFTYSQNPLCKLPSIISFNNLSTNASIFNWSFGAFGTSLDSLPHLDTLSVSANFQATLLSNNIYNCPSSVTLPVHFEAPPVAQFQFTTGPICNGKPLSFTNLSVDSLNSQWLFSDGGSSSLPSLQYTFADSGNFDVTLIVKNDSLCTDSLTLPVYISPQAISDFTFVQTPLCSLPSSVKFDNESTNADNYTWSFGQLGGTSLLPNPSIDTLTNSTLFNVTLIADNAHGCADTLIKPVKFIAPPIAAFSTLPDTVCLGSPIFFTNLSQNTSGAFNWMFGDSSASTHVNPIHTYNDTGTYSVTLIATGDTSVCKDTAQSFIVIYPYAQASFYSNSLPICGLPKTVQFNSSDSTIFADTYLWLFNFGGFDSSNVPNPTLNNVNVSGTFPITLIANNFQNCPDTVTNLITLLDQPEAAFTSSDSTSCINTIDLSFTNNSTNAITYTWNMDDGNTLNQFEVLNYLYHTTGVYNVSLIAVNDVCADTAYHLQYVNDIPQVSFSAQQVDTSFNAQGNSINKTLCSVYGFTPSPVSSSLIYQWQFGDGYTDTVRNPVHIFYNNGFFNVSLAVTDSNFCSNDTSILLSINCDGQLLIPNAIALATSPSPLAFFVPKGYRIESLLIEIFSPNGQKLWSCDKVKPPDNSPDCTWDGTYNNLPLPQGAYTWKAWVKFQGGRGFIFPDENYELNYSTENYFEGVVTIFR